MKVDYKFLISTHRVKYPVPFKRFGSPKHWCNISETECQSLMNIDLSSMFIVRPMHCARNYRMWRHSGKSCFVPREPDHSQVEVRGSKITCGWTALWIMKLLKNKPMGEGNFFYRDFSLKLVRYNINNISILFIISSISRKNFLWLS